MPTCEQADIFEMFLSDPSVQLAVVFGYLGFNELRQSWDAHRGGLQGLDQVSDPFLETQGNPIEAARGRWMMFIAAGENQGMTDKQIRESLSRACQWAVTRGLRQVATNGIRDCQHGPDTQANRVNDDQRARFLGNYATELEQEHNLRIRLISRNDVFVRNAL